MTHAHTPHWTQYLGIALFSLLLSSCSYYQYAPNMQNVPLLRAKGEARLAVARSGAGLEMTGTFEASGTEFQSAYAVTNHMGLMLNSAKFKDTSVGTESTGGVGRIAELGAGYYHPLGKHWVVEGFGGIGRGDVSYPDRRFPFWRGFAQPSIGFASTHFDIGMSGRFVYLVYDDVALTDHVLATLSPDAPALSGAGRMLFEPGIFLRAGTRAVKLQLQFCFSENLGRPLSMLQENYSIGLQININNAFRRKSQPQSIPSQPHS